MEVGLDGSSSHGAILDAFMNLFAPPEYELVLNVIALGGGCHLLVLRTFMNFLVLQGLVVVMTAM